MKRPFSIALLIIGLVLTILVFYNVGLWWMISADSSKTFDEIKFEYRSHYPYYLQNLTLLTFIDVVMSSVAGLCFFKITKSFSVPGNIVIRGLSIMHLILTSWFIFSLM